MRSSFGTYIRYTSTLLIVALTWDGLAHAARPSAKLSALQAQTQPQQQSPAAAAAPPQATPPPAGMSVRDRMLAAHTVFLSLQSVDPNFAVSGTAAYDAVLDALHQWGRYQVVNDPSRADLIFQLHGQVTSYASSGTPPDYTPDVYYTSTLQLTVADPQTLSPLWRVDVPLQYGLHHKARTLHIATTGENAISDLKEVVGDPLTKRDQAALKTIHTANQRVILFAVAGIAAVAVGAIVGLHLVHSSAQSFCQQHNLSPCPGS